MKVQIIPAILLPIALFAQSESPKNVLKVISGPAITAKPGSTIHIPLSLQVDEGYHVNSNAPSEDFLIPLRLTWSPGALQNTVVSFPKPQFEKFAFSEKPLSVFKGTFEVGTRFKVSADAKPGPASVTGKLHYQACNDRMCLTPRTLDVSVPIEIVK